MPFHRPIPESHTKRKASGGIEALVEGEKALQLALILPSAVFVGWVFGALADRWLHQSWIGIAGLVFGAVSGLVYIIRFAITAERGSRPGGAAGGTEKESPKAKP
jgi:ATP synthase protein I